MKNILVTGSLGFIGHNVCNFLKRDHHVNGIDAHVCYEEHEEGIRQMDRLFSERYKRVGEFHPDSNLLTVQYDILNSDLGDIFGEKFDIIIHLASYPRQVEVAKNPVDATNVMINGLKNTLEAYKGAGRRFVFVSSSMVYGDFENFVKEDAPCSPNTLYGQLKLMGEGLVKKFCEKHDMEYTIIRPSAVYGERDVNTRLVGKFLTQAIKGEPLVIRGKDEIIDFSYVEDTAMGIAQASVSPNAANKTYNITRSSPTPRTILEAGEIIKHITKSNSPLVVEERDKAFPKRGNLSIEAAQTDFAYKPTTNIEEGFRRYYDWMRKFYQY